MNDTAKSTSLCDASDEALALRAKGGDDEALELADRAQGFFLFAGRQLLADLGVVVVRVENTQSRSAFDTDETDRRYGFDVLFRYEREDKRAVPAISKPPITFTKEE